MYIKLLHLIGPKVSPFLFIYSKTMQHVKNIFNYFNNFENIKYKYIYCNVIKILPHTVKYFLFLNKLSLFKAFNSFFSKREIV